MHEKGLFSRLVRFTLALIILLVGGVSLLPSSAVYAAGNFTVTKMIDTNDGVCDADCSLREAINAANVDGQPDTITVPTGLYGLSSTLTIAADGGKLLTINGSGTIISGLNTVEVFMINSGASVAFNNLVITGGSASGGTGGGLYNDGAVTLTNSTISSNSSYYGSGLYNSRSGTVTLTNSTVSDNHAVIQAGGIYNYGGTMTLTDSTVSGNSAQDGGGIYNGGFVTLTNSTVSGNSGSIGGGIYNDSLVTLTNSTVSANTSSSTGGGLYSAGPVVLTNSTIFGNSASDGGGLYSYNGIITLTNSTVSGNTATTGAGGGLYNGYMLRLTNSAVSNNSAAISGGGLHNKVGSTATVINSTLSGNTSGTGGGLLNNGTVELINSTVSNNTATANGGGIASGGSVTVTNSTVSTNSATFGGGFYLSSSTAALNNSTVSANSANNTGGGIYGVTSTVNLNNSIIANSPSGGDCSVTTISASNSLIEGGGCGVTNGVNGNITGVDPALGSFNGIPGSYTLLPGSPAINTGSNALIPGGITTDEAGNPRIQGGVVDMGAVESGFSGLLVDTKSDANLRACTDAPGDCSLRGAINEANRIPGADTITFDSTVFNPKAIVLSSALPTISDDLTISGLGTGLVTIDGANQYQLFIIRSGATVNLSDLTLTNSGGNGSGGAIKNAGKLIGSSLLFTSNSADQGGGLYNAGAATIRSSTFSSNSAGSNGGAIYNLSGGLTLSGSTLSGNSARAGAGLGVANGTVFVINSTLTGNTASVSGGGGLDMAGGTTKVTLINSTFANNAAVSNPLLSGIWQESGTLTVQNTIVANNSGANNCYFGGGSHTDGGHNLDNGTSCGFGGATGQNTDPLLSALANNGGLTQTLALQAGSPAIDAGDTTLAVDENHAALLYDQRDVGFPRVIGAAVDIGAFETTLPAPTILTNPPNQTIPNGQTATLMVIASGLSLSYQWYQGSSGTTTTPVGTDSDTFTTLPLTSTTNYWVRVTNSGGSIDSATATITVESAVADHLAFVQQPSAGLIGLPISPAITVELRDSSNFPVLDDGVTVTLTFGTNTTGATLGGTLNADTVGGVATFNNVTVDTAGTGYTLVASASGLTSAESTAFAVTAPLIQISDTNPILVITDPGNLVTEGASIGDRFAFNLTQPPTSDVTVTFSSTDATQLEIIDPTVVGRYAPVGSYTITFSATGAHGAHTVPWNALIVLNLYGVPDAVAEGAQNYAIHIGFASSDPAYNGLSVPDVPVTVYDAGVSNTPSSLTLPKGGSGSYSIVLDGPPGFLALTTAKGGNQDEHVVVTANGTDYTFTRLDWDTPQTVPVTVPDNGSCTGAYDLTISETETSDINLNPYMDSGYGGPSSPAPNVGAPDEVIHVTDPHCTTGAEVNHGAPPALNGSTPNSVSPGSNPAPSGSSDLPPSVDAMSGQ